MLAAKLPHFEVVSSTGLYKEELCKEELCKENLGNKDPPLPFLHVLSKVV